MEKDPYKGPEQAQEIHRSNIEDSNINQNQLNVSVYTGQPQATTEHKLDRQEYRNRQALLDKVKQFWVKGVLERSLYSRAKIELGLEERFDALNIEYAYPETPPQPLPSSITVREKFFDKIGVGRTLLVLGAPGAGKTTTLLELTRDLIVKAEENADSPIPIVFNLSSWSNPKQSILNWLLDEFSTKYQVNKKISQKWLNMQCLFLMLDGLDEVKADIRKACVEEINSFHQIYGQTEIVVCCRIADYEKINKFLNFNSAVFIKPLNFYQIKDYLDKAGESLSGVRQAIAGDTALKELASSPLMLSIIALAYQDALPDLAEDNDIETTRKNIFKTYVRKMLLRRGHEASYEKRKTINWLRELAINLSQESETVFLIENIQPSWLRSRYDRWLYTLGVGISVGLSTCLLLSPIFEWLSSQVSLSAPISYILGAGLSSGLIWGIAFLSFKEITSTPLGQVLIGILGGVFWGTVVFSLGNFVEAIIGSGLIYGLALGLISGIMTPEIKVIERLEWSWSTAKSKLTSGLIIGLVAGSLLGSIFGFFTAINLTNGIFAVTMATVTFGALSGLIFELIGGIASVLIGGFSSAEVSSKIKPNWGILQSSKYTLRILILSSFLFGIGILAFQLPITFAISLGSLTALLTAGSVLIKHFLLRLIMFNTSLAPWNYSTFLNYCSACILLQKVGGGYIFIHRSFLDYFRDISDKDLNEIIL